VLIYAEVISGCAYNVLKARQLLPTTTQRKATALEIENNCDRDLPLAKLSAPEGSHMMLRLFCPPSNFQHVTVCQKLTANISLI
jgi:hypothetical protein